MRTHFNIKSLLLLITLAIGIFSCRETVKKDSNNDEPMENSEHMDEDGHMNGDDHMDNEHMNQDGHMNTEGEHMNQDDTHMEN